MLKAEQVPEEVWKALRREIEGPGLRYWNEVFAAALNAWPGMEHVFRQPHRLAFDYSKPAIILPLPQKESSE